MHSCVSWQLHILSTVYKINLNHRRPTDFYYFKGSGYGYGTVPGGRWTIDTEGDHVVVSVSLI